MRREPEIIPGPATRARASGSRNYWARITHDYVSYSERAEPHQPRLHAI